MKHAFKLMLVAVTIALAFTPADVVASASPREALLSVVPADAVSVGMIHVDDMRRSPTAQKVFAKMSAGGLDMEADELLKEAGLTPAEDVDHLMVVLRPSATQGEPQVLVAASGRFDPVRLADAIQRRGATRKTANGATYYLLPEEEVKPGEHPAVCFYNGNLVLAGMEQSVVNALTTIGSGQDSFATSRLGRELFRIDDRASGWMLFDVQKAKSMASMNAPGASPFGEQAFTAISNLSTVSLWVAETSEGLEFGSTALTSDAETRGLVEDVLKGALSTFRIAAQEKQPELVKVARTFKVASSGDSVTLTGSVPTDVIDAFVAGMK